MRCKNRWESKTKGYETERIAPLHAYRPHNCGVCINCRINTAQSYALRMVHEQKLYPDGKTSFITLTYDDDYLPINRTLVKWVIPDYIRKLRDKTKEKIRYVAVGEYGEQEYRPHYHIGLYGLSPDEKLLKTEWPLGIVHVKDMTEFRAHYTNKYRLSKALGLNAEWYKQLGVIPEFQQQSLKPGIGWDYAKNFKDIWLENGFIHNAGKKVPIPRYYFNKFLPTDLEKLRWYKKHDIQIQTGIISPEEAYENYLTSFSEKSNLEMKRLQRFNK